LPFFCPFSDILLEKIENQRNFLSTQISYLVVFRYSPRKVPEPDMFGADIAKKIILSKKGLDFAERLCLFFLPAV